MKITGLEVFAVPPRWVFLKVTTDEGIVGWGEPTLEGWAYTMKAAVEEISHYFIGQDPLRIEYHWQALFRNGCYRGGPVLMSLIAGIDQALWDIKGKYLGVPVYQLIGGNVRESTDVITWIHGDSPSSLADEVKRIQQAGYNNVKMNATDEMHYIDSYKKMDEAVSRIASVRDAGGPYIGIGVDFHGRVHKSMAKILAKELEPYRPMFYEDPVLSEHMDCFKEIAQHTTVPLVIGERLYSRWDFKRVFEDGFVGIINPDLSHAGGITECKKIIYMAEAYDIAVAPHCPIGPIALASCLQLGAASNNVFLQEVIMECVHSDYVIDSSVFNIKDGYIGIPNRPGLGIEIDEEYVREKSKDGPHFRAPFWSNKDGTVAEW